MKTPMKTPTELILEAFPWLNPTEDFRLHQDQDPPPGFVKGYSDTLVFYPCPGIQISIGEIGASNKDNPICAICLKDDLVCFNPKDGNDILGAVSWAVKTAMDTPAAMEPTFKAFRVTAKNGIWLPSYLRQSNQPFFALPKSIVLMGPDTWPSSYQLFQASQTLGLMPTPWEYSGFEQMKDFESLNKVNLLAPEPNFNLTARGHYLNALRQEDCVGR